MLYGVNQEQPATIRPKRRKSKDNPYTLFIRDDRYYVSFRDGEGIHQEVELTAEQYLAFDSFELEDKREANERERYYRQSEPANEPLCRRTALSEESMEDIVLAQLEKDNLRKAIQQMPEIQRRRVILYFFNGLTYKEIAAKEGCTIMPVKRSIDNAIKKIKKILE